MKYLLTALAFAALIAGVSFLLNSPEPDMGATGTAVGRAAADAAGGGDLAGPADMETVEGNPVERSEAPALAAPENVPAMAAAAETPDDEADKPALVTGRLLNEAGVPLPGADVRLQRSGFDGFLTGELATGQGMNRSRAVQTDADGRFTLEVESRQTKLLATMKGFAPYESPVELPRGETLDLGDVFMARGVTLSGRVLGPGGQPVEGAELRAERKQEAGLTLVGGPKQPAVAVTDRDGRFAIESLAVGPYAFQVESTDHPSQSFAGETERPGQIVDGIVVTLRPGASIAGVVTGIPAGETEPFTVIARPRAAGGSGDFFFGDQGSASVDGSGRFELTGLEPGAEFDLYLRQGRRRFDGASRRSRIVPAKTGDRDVRLAFAKGASVRLRAIDVAGEPLEELTVTAGFGFAMQRFSADDPREGGEVLVDGLWPGEAGEELELEVQCVGHDTYKPEGLVLVPGQVLDLGDVILADRHQVSFVVTALQGGTAVGGASVSMKKYVAPVPGRREVRASFSSSSSDDSDLDDVDMEAFEFGESVSGITNTEGRVSLDASPGESYEFTIRHKDFAEHKGGPITVSASQRITEVPVSLEPGGNVLITVVDPDGNPVKGARVEQRGDDPLSGMMLGGGSARISKASGEVVINGLAPGTASFRLAEDTGGQPVVISFDGLMGDDDDESWTEVTVMPGDTARLTLVAPARGELSGKITELGAALAGAKLTLKKPGSAELDGLMGFGGGGGPKATSDARGRFRFADVEAGKYDLVIKHSSRAMDFKAPVEIEGGAQTFNVDLDVTIVEGRVTNEDGEPVKDAKVSAAAKESSDGPMMISMVVMDGGSGGGGAMVSLGGSEAETTTTDEDGRYTLRGVTPDKELQVTAKAEGYDDARSEPFEVNPGSTRSGIDVVFVTPGAVRIEVPGNSERLIASLRKEGEPGGQPRVEMINGETSTVDALEPGTYAVSLNAMGPSGGTITPESMTVEVVAGETATASFVLE